VSERPATRTEHDLLGAVEVAEDALWGAHTERAIANFPLRGERSIGGTPELITALIQVKHAAATANMAAGSLGREVGVRIRSACEELIERPRLDEFPVHVLHGGGGTSANMNANEVVANMAALLAGEQLGSYASVHPTGHVNLNQSTNDVFPTACRLAVRSRWRSARGTIGGPIDEVRQLRDALMHEPRLARTCLQDAVPATFGDLLGAYESFLRRGVRRIDTRVDALCEVSLGGGVMGRTDGIPPAYLDRVVGDLADVSGWTDLAATADRSDAAQHLDDLVDVADAIEVLARGIVRIAKDLRLLASGPDGGIGEITLAPRQAGSSAMPGKVNPVMPEHAVLLCWRAIGLCASVRSTLDHAELDLNVWESAALMGVLDAIDLVVAAALALGRSFDGLQVRRDTIGRQLGSVIPLAVRATAVHGHALVEDLAARAAGDPDRLRSSILALLEHDEV
jgi:aspartate ammonia-lyase